MAAALKHARRIKIIIVDYSQVALSTIFQFQSELKKSNIDRNQAVNVIRHATLTGIKALKKKYSQEYGELVLACDGKRCWRKKVFPAYKAGRKATRDKSDLDWKLIFDTISEIRDDLARVFPYKVVHFEEAEADDVIATLCKWTQTNGLINHTLFDEKQPVLIISSDGDFKQLHKYDNVSQWSPIQKKRVVCDDPVAYLAGHIAKAGDDGIPNVLSPDEVFITEGVRQTKMTATRLTEFVSKGRDACRNDEERRNWDRNNTLINFEKIPEDVSANIINLYLNNKPNGDRMSIYQYLIDHKCRLLLDELEEF